MFFPTTIDVAQLLFVLLLFTFRPLASLLTFPGVVVHEIGHAIVCVWFRLRIFKICYFQFGDPAGYVTHERAHRFLEQFWIAVGPLLSNSALALASFLASSIPGLPDFASLGLVWLGVSVAAQAFPSESDGAVLLRFSIERLFKFDILAILGFPAAFLIWVANLFRRVFWFNFVYAIGLWWCAMRFSSLPGVL